jgi:UDP-N-acetylmuramoylalanine--D-glutamate ligase
MSYNDTMRQTLVVLGAGESGVGAAVLAKKIGWAVFVSDLGLIKAEFSAMLVQENIPFEQEKHSTERILNIAKLVIKSPGIPDTADLVVALRARGVEVIDEMEFAFRHKPAGSKLVAITGSNGKTTTTRLIHHLLVASGRNAALVGNVGYSFAKHIATETAADYYVAEMSSFQLDGTTEFRPDIALLLNITPDHLDRYGYDFNNYIASKFRIAQKQTPDDILIYNADNEGIALGLSQNLLPSPPPQTRTLPVSGLIQNRSNDLGQNEPYLAVPFVDFEIPMSALPLKGQHNAYNMASAVLAVQALGLTPAEIAAALPTFENEAHRLQYIQTLNEVDYINDSKATNVDSVWYALDAMTRPVVWIVGGVDKGNDYSPLFDLVRQKVRAIVCLGRDNSKIRAAFEPIQPIIEETISMGEAIKVASLYAEAGDVVLLSPACASFDLFQNYKDRGDQFAQIVRQSYEIMTKGQAISLNLSFNLRPSDSQTDSTLPPI